MLRHLGDENEAGDDDDRAPHAEQSRDHTCKQAEQCVQNPCHTLCPFPQPPPPGVSMRSTSPARSCKVAFEGIASPFSRFAPAAPAPPPAPPAGPWRRRSVSSVASIGASASNSRTTPSPPAHSPFPPLPPRRAYVRSRSGCSISKTSIGVFRVFDIPTCTPDGPLAPRLAPCPPPIVS